jgi:hypothetical protein
MDWTDLAKDRNKWRPLENTAVNLQDPQSVGQLFSSYTNHGFSRGQLYAVSLYIHNSRVALHAPQASPMPSGEQSK